MEVVLKASDGDAELRLRDVSGSRSGIQFELSARSRGFAGTLPSGLESAELEKFIEDLQHMHKTLQGKAELRSHGDEDGATLTMDQLGGVAVEVVLVHYKPPEHRLKLGFRSDQSYLPRFIESLVTAGKACGALL